MHNIKCGNCRQTHPTVEDVRTCHSGFSAPVRLDPSQKQLDYAHGLFRAKALPADSPLAVMSATEAHEFINAMSRPEIGEFISLMKEQPYGEERQRTERITVDEGMYQYSGKIYRVQRAVHGSGHLYAKIYSKDTGKFSHAPNVLSRLDPKHKMTLEEAQKFGALYGTCMVCGRTLTDEDSIAAGIGPICANKEGYFA